MTTFEITIIVLLAVIVVLLIVLLRIAVEGFQGVWQNQNAGVEQLCNIEVNTHHASGVLQKHITSDVKSISQELNNIEDNILDEFIPVFKKLLEHNENIENFWAADSSLVIKLLKEIRNCLTQDINWGELTDNQKSEILYRLTHPVVESPFKPPFNPTCETTNKED